MNRALRRVSLRYLSHHPWQFGLAILGIALGVAVVVAVDLTNASAQRALRLSVEQVTGRATHTLTGPSEGIPDSLYTRLKAEWGYTRAAPRIEGFAEIEGEVYELLGVDPFAEGGFHRTGRTNLAAPSLSVLLTRPGAFLTSETVRRELGISEDQTVSAVIAGHRQTLTLAGILDSESGSGARFLVVDLSSAQELLGLHGALHGIDLILTESEARALTKRLPAGYHLAPSEGRAAELEAMTRGFRLNLTALSLLALIVGGFLIYNTMTFSVVQRRDLFGLLRAVGATRSQVLVVVVGEAGIIGLLGTLLGLFGGVLLAQGLVQLVTRTINDLYYVLTVREFFFDSSTLMKGLILGLAVSLISAAFPAWEAGKVSPRTAMTRSLLESRVRRVLPWLAVVGGGVAFAGMLWLGQSETVEASFLGLFALILGLAMASPLAMVVVLNALRAVLPQRGFVLGRLAVRGMDAALSRTAAAIVALMIAIAASLGMGIMVNSFRATVVDWLGYHLQADIFLSVPGHYTRRSSTPLQPQVVDQVRADPRIANVATWRGMTVESGKGATRLSVLEPAPRSRQGYRFLNGKPDVVWEAVLTDSVLVSESFAFRHHLKAGETLQIHTEQGVQRFPIAGVYYDYGNDRGTVLMARGVFNRFWTDRTVSALGLYLHDDVDALQVISDLRRGLTGLQRLRLRSNRELREASLEIFDRTFTITQVLRLLAVGAAFIAVVSALMAIQLERSREFAIFRATGLTPAQMWRLMLGQTLLMGSVATLFALPVGFALAWVLTEVINRQSFGWSIGWQVVPVDVIGVCLLGLSAALLAAIYPAWRIARTPPALALRDE